MGPVGGEVDLVVPQGELHPGHPGRVLDQGDGGDVQQQDASQTQGEGDAQGFPPVPPEVPPAQGPGGEGPPAGLPGRHGPLVGDEAHRLQRGDPRGDLGGLADEMCIRDRCKRGLSGKRSPAAEGNSGPPVLTKPYRTCSPAAPPCGRRGTAVPRQRYAGRSALPSGGNARHSTADRPGGPAAYGSPPCCTGWDGPGAADGKRCESLQRRFPR